MQKKNIAIICPTNLPVPAVKGGAIEALIENFIDQNEIFNNFQIYIISKYSENAFEKSKEYNFTKFIWLKSKPQDLILRNWFKFYNLLNRLVFPKRIPTSIDGYYLKKIFNNGCFDYVIVEGNGDYLHNIKNSLPKNKIIFHIHSYFHCNSTPLNRYLLNIPGKVISVSNFISKSLINNLELSNDNISTVMNCIHPQFFVPAENDGEYFLENYNQNKINIVFTGRIVKEKGIIELIEALNTLKYLNNWHLYIIGSFGSSFANTKSKNQSDIELEFEIRNKLNDLESFYSILGFIDNKLLPQIYKKFNLAIAPSICKEAANLAVAEYICSNIPVIASDQGGIPEYLDIDCGILVHYDKNFIPNLAKSIKYLITNPTVLSQMSGKCSMVKHKYSSIRYFAEISSILN
ncbi:MAG: glycosyltransferase family 4 protein [Saprospiraceae bacterium]|nr:glycosyltransferase family 4 protein [Saprospiraceae bacterium]